VSEQLERDPVTVVEEPAPENKRVGSSDILDAIRALPDAVAARISGKPAAGGTGDGVSEVTFVGDPIPEAPKAGPAAAGPAAPAAPTVHRPLYGHPSRSRRNADEAIV
jgi:hypothetical protein